MQLREKEGLLCLRPQVMVHYSVKLRQELRTEIQRLTCLLFHAILPPTKELTDKFSQRMLLAGSFTALDSASFLTQLRAPAQSCLQQTGPLLSASNQNNPIDTHTGALSCAISSLRIPYQVTPECIQLTVKAKKDRYER